MYQYVLKSGEELPVEIQHIEAHEPFEKGLCAFCFCM